jgi:hypothetical protein
MAVNIQFWDTEIAKNIFDNNPFINFAKDHSGYVRGSVVNIPNAGSAPTVERNRTSLPATIAKRTDSAVTYNIDEFTTDPIVITNLEEAETSYDKMQNVMDEHFLALSASVGDWMAYNWAATADGNIVATTGSAVANHVGTANVKAMTGADLRKAMRIIDYQTKSSSLGTRYALIDAYMYEQLLSDVGYQSGRISITEADMAMGVVNELFGFKIIKRSFVTKYNATTLQAPTVDLSGSATGWAGAICWDRNYVARAIGNIELYSDERNPTYYGDVVSALVRAGGRKLYNAGTGIVSVVGVAG